MRSALLQTTMIRICFFRESWSYYCGTLTAHHTPILGSRKELHKLHRSFINVNVCYFSGARCQLMQAMPHLILFFFLSSTEPLSKFSHSSVYSSFTQHFGNISFNSLWKYCKGRLCSIFHNNDGTICNDMQACAHSSCTVNSIKSTASISEHPDTQSVCTFLCLGIRYLSLWFRYAGR